MVKITRRVPTENDILSLAKQLRASDIAELNAVTDLTPLEAIRTSIVHSSNEFLGAYFANEILLCIAGCSHTGTPWLLATPALQHHTYRLTKTAKHSVRMMLRKYPMLSNMIDVRQIQTIRWLQTLGFIMTDTLEIKPGYPVICFQKVRDERNIKHTTRVTGL